MLPLRTIAALAAGGFAILATLVAAGTATSSDSALSQAAYIFGREHPEVREFFLWTTHLGDKWVLVGVALVSVGMLWIFGRDPRTAVVIAITMALTPILTTMLKWLFVRSRPVWDDPFLTETGYSFPSGHATGATIIYGLLAGLALRRLKGWLRSVIVTFLIGVTLLTGTSRVILGVHYPADVIAGFAIGLAVVALALAIATPPTSPTQGSELRSGHDRTV